MSDLPESSELEKAVKKLVRKSKKEGQLSTLTPRIIRQEVEKLFSLENGALDAKKYKVALKQAMMEVMIGDYETGGSDASLGNKKVKKRKAGGQGEVLKKAKVARKRKSTSAETSEVPGQSSKDVKIYKSSAIVESSDAEAGDADLEIRPASTSNPNAKISLDSDEAVKVQDRQKAFNRQSSSSSAKAQNVDVTPKVSIEENVYKSESELSVLIDEPKRSKKSKSKDKESAKTKEAKQKKTPGAGLSKDEETIKRLKSLVVACGVRKVWKKEFQGLDTPSQQIQRVRDILAGLGMSGRFGLEQARAIKAKRELAKELEDVQLFEKTIVSGQSSYSQVKAKHNSASDEDQDQEGKERGSDSEEQEVPKKRKSTARMSIMAFLGDQSGEE